MSVIFIVIIIAAALAVMWVLFEIFEVILSNSSQRGLTLRKIIELLYEHNRNKLFPRRNCPKCGSKQTVKVYDKGFKKLYRMIIKKNRYHCSKCKVTWRSSGWRYFK